MRPGGKSRAGGLAQEERGGTMSRRTAVAVCGFIACAGLLAAAAAPPPRREAEAPADPGRQRLHDLAESLHFAEEALTRIADEQTLFRRLEDLAVVDEPRYTGPPPRVITNATAQGAANPVIFP